MKNLDPCGNQKPPTFLQCLNHATVYPLGGGVRHTINIICRALKHHTGKGQRQSHVEGQVSGPIVAVSRKSLSYHLRRRLGSTQVWSGLVWMW
jgi:hypothetical protein